MAWENQADDACLEPKFLEGLDALQSTGLLWEFCCEPRMAPHLPACRSNEAFGGRLESKVNRSRYSH